MAAQLDPRLDAPKPADLHNVGTLATVHKVVRMPNQSRFVFTEGVERVRLVRYVQTEPFMIAEIETVEDVEPETSFGVLRHWFGTSSANSSRSCPSRRRFRMSCGRSRGISKSRAAWWISWLRPCRS